jgi:cellulose synthase/poly-beta-1,6-N-acetylglucosamine synthase-like glycosyltransferase
VWRVPPVLSVVVVSDYAAGGPDAWEDIRDSVAALAAQRGDVDLEVLVVEDERLASQAPPDLLDACPGATLVAAPEPESYGLKNAGVRAASAPLVAILDADCVPLAGWARAIVEAYERDPEIAAVSGRTDYGGRTARERIFALLTRAYVDPGRRGRTRFVSNNNAAWRRTTLLAHPLPTGLGPFAARIQSEAAARAGARFGFEPDMRAVHAFEGVAMEVDIRRNIGFGTIAARRADGRLPFAWLTRAGRLSIPAFVAGKSISTWRDCARAFRAYGLRRRELAVAVLLVPVVQLAEASGMWRAFTEAPIERSAYR